MDNSIFQTLEKRGYVYQCTNYEEVKRILSSEEPVTFYLGIDPTADSLHIGHFFALMMFRYLQDAGHQGIIVIGGATALVGDPSGKSDMRKMLTKEEVQHNLEEVKELVTKFIRTDGDNPAIILNNADWINPYSYVDFMRDIGVHFNVNKMLAADAYASRITQGGLTFLEMGYMLMQAYDFVHLNKKHNCRIQIGGSDQWGNIIAGTGLNRKLKHLEENIESYGDDIYGLTNPLLLTKEGKKMGKTENGTLWVARDKTTPYDFYQYFYNVNDEDVSTLLRLFTRLPLEEIENLMKENILKAKRVMAYEITKLVHGKSEADNVILMVDSLFKKGNTGDVNAPEVKIRLDDFILGYNITNLLVDTGICSSKSEARRLILQGGISVNDLKIENVDEIIKCSDRNKTFLLRKGKKKFVKVVFE